MILENIITPADVKELDPTELKTLCDEIRGKILDSVSQNGGHLASNLGAVELTVAFHKAFSSPGDKLIFDVGHQSYAHKLLTGRREGFEKLRSDDGVSGFTKRSESVHDPFGSGHSGNAVSAATGLAAADKLNGNSNYTIALVGDGGFTNGMTYEALNNCTDKRLKLIIILNDNEMAISRNVGTIDNVFSRMRTSKRYFRFKNNFIRHVSAIPLIGKTLVIIFKNIKDFFKHIVLKENFFENMGFDYYGPVDGNNVEKLTYVFEQAKKSDKICVIHAFTRKGKGYKFAEEKPDAYHSVAKFNIDNGIVSNGKEKTFSHNAGKILENRAESDVKICAVTAAMTAGTGLDGFAARYPERFFDVGIAEEHAATFCAGLSAGGFKPVFAVYSTFMQRCFDQLAEDVSMQSLSLTLLIDRAGLVGDDGITHHGIFDVSLLNKIPKTLIYSPDSIEELGVCMDKCLEYNGLSAVRYPKGTEQNYDKGLFIQLNTLSYADFGSPEKVIITYGRLTGEAVKAAAVCKNIRVIKLIRIKPVDFDALLPLVGDMPVLFAEEVLKQGGIGETFAYAAGVRT
ncbi:MAG: 1-deoxy-D-xylulose-5-phosphate synthase, partial [Eubacteriales bacterium]|nr:1-deoxy-D-xylulose-5-phosphate synthase [Eubacteriales bacterium]